MYVTNLALATDLAVAALDAQIIDRGDHLVVSTPTNPDFYWGNYLVLSSPPAAAALPHWCTVATEAFPTSAHVALTWDGNDNDGGPSTVGALKHAGFTLDRTLALRAAKLTRFTPSPRSGDGVNFVNFARLDGDRGWAQLGELGFLVEDGGDAYRAFAMRKLGARRQACERGVAMWWGAFAGDELIASAGIVRDGSRARYQDVQTAPAYRRRGVASALLAEIAVAEANAGVEELVICVDIANVAARAAYEKLGFAAGQVLVAAYRAPAASGPYQTAGARA